MILTHSDYNTNDNVRTVKDDHVKMLFDNQKCRQDEYNYSNRLNLRHPSLFQDDLPLKLSLYRNKTGNKAKTKSQFTFHPPFSTKQSYDEGFEKGLQQNLIDQLNKAFNNLDNYLSPTSLALLKSNSNLTALKKSYVQTKYFSLSSLAFTCTVFV